MGLNGIRVNIGDRDQRSHTVRTPAFCHLPVVICYLLAIDCFLLRRYGRVRVVVSGVRIHVGRDILVDLHIHVTADIETVDVVILGLTEVQEVALTIVAQVRIKLRTVVTTFDRYGNGRIINEQTSNS